MIFFYTHFYYLPNLYLLTCFILKYYASTTLVFFLFLKYSNFFCLKAVELDAVLVYYSLLCCVLPLSRVWVFVTLWTLACHAPLSVRFSRQAYWSGLPCPPPGDLPKPRIESWHPALRQIPYHLSCQGNVTILVSTLLFISTLLVSCLVRSQFMYSFLREQYEASSGWSTLFGWMNKEIIY